MKAKDYFLNEVNKLPKAHRRYTTNVYKKFLILSDQIMYSDIEYKVYLLEILKKDMYERGIKYLPKELHSYLNNVMISEYRGFLREFQLAQRKEQSKLSKENNLKKISNAWLT